jgi:hypothetical protein
MTSIPKAESRLLESIHETASDLHQLGFIDKRRMQKYDVLCLLAEMPDGLPRVEGWGSLSDVGKERV